MKVDIQLADADATMAVDRTYESRFDEVESSPQSVAGVCSLPSGGDVQLDMIAAEE